MGISEVRSPNNRERDRFPSRDRPGTSPNSAPRSDQRGPHEAGKGWLPVDLRDQEGPVEPVSDKRR